MRRKKRKECIKSLQEESAASRRYFNCWLGCAQNLPLSFNSQTLRPSHDKSFRFFVCVRRYGSNWLQHWVVPTKMVRMRRFALFFSLCYFKHYWIVCINFSLSILRLSFKLSFADAIFDFAIYIFYVLGWHKRRRKPSWDWPGRMRNSLWISGQKAC